MFDSPLDFFSLVIALVAFIFARKAKNQVASLRARLEQIEAIRAAAARPVPPPLTPTQEFEQPLAPSPRVAPQPPPLAPDTQSVAPAAAAKADANDPPGSAPPPPPPLPPPPP